MKLNKRYALSANEGASTLAKRDIIVAHSTATPNGEAWAIAHNMKAGINTAQTYVHLVVDDKECYLVGGLGYVAWGCGYYGNQLSPMQIELCEFTNKTRAKKAYRNYIGLIREYAQKYGIPLTLDNNAKRGVKTHNWVTHNLGNTDHSDPYGYLSSIGISKAQFAHDIANGVGGKVAATKKPAKSAGKKSSWVKKPGTFVLGKALKLHTSPHINAPAIAVLPKGSAIKYDAVLQGPKRLWLRQPRANGYGYIVGKDKYGKAMGQFK